jgi:myogenesis-regulating glycosidase
VFEFDKKKFPQPKQMITKLKELNFRVTLWIHPFVSCHSWQFFRYWRRDLFIPLNIVSSIIDILVERSRALQWIFDEYLYNSALCPLIRTIYQQFPVTLPGIGLWWNGLAGVLDFTRKEVQDEYVSNLKRLQTMYGIDSFKFDAGEVNWLPILSSLTNPSSHQLTSDEINRATSLGLYPNLYAQLAYRIDESVRLQEVRVGYRTQTLPVFVRIIDKDSNWSYNNGLRSMLPSIFNLSLLGYPFILPDMVGNECDPFKLECSSRSILD